MAYYPVRFKRKEHDELHRLRDKYGYKSVRQMLLAAVHVMDLGARTHEEMYQETKGYDLRWIPEKNEWGSAGICMGCPYKQKCPYLKVTSEHIVGPKGWVLAQTKVWEDCPVRAIHNPQGRADLR